MNILSLVTTPVAFHKTGLRALSLMMILLISGGLAAQFPNPDAIVLFSRSPVSGTAAAQGAGGAFSSVGADLSCLSLNPAGLGLYKTSDLCITPGLRFAADRSTYDGNTANALQPAFELAQGGAVFTKKMRSYSDHTGGTSLKSYSIAINFEGGDFYARNQKFSDYNTSGSLVSNYAAFSNQAGGIPTLDAFLLNYFNLLGYNSATNTYYSNVKSPVLQSGFMQTQGYSAKVSLGFGANFSDKLFFGFSLAVPILNYTVNTQMTETNPNPNDTTSQFVSYQLNSSVNEFGMGFTGNLGLIYQPVSWMRLGISYGLPTWLFLNENYSSTLSFTWDSTGYQTVPTQSNPAFAYRLRMPMKGVVGASFYFAENSFFSADYELQNIGSTRYYVPNDSFGLSPDYNSYLKQTYTYTHTLKLGIQGAIKKFRIRAGYSYISSPFKDSANYLLQYGNQYKSYNEAVQTFTFGLGLAFKQFYIDMAYVVTYSKDGLSPNYQVPLDEITSRLFTHTALLTVGMRIPAKGDKGSSSTPAKKQRSSDQLPRYIDPGDKY